MLAALLLPAPVLVLVLVAACAHGAAAQLVTYTPPVVEVLGQPFALFDSADVDQELMDGVAVMPSLHAIVFSTSSPTASWTLPPEIGALTDLQAMYVLNSLAGTLPSELGLMSSLTFLRVEYSTVHGTLPTQLGQVSDLKHLSLVGNRDLEGPLPSQLGLTKLEELRLEQARVAGPVPSQLLLLTNLQLVSLASLHGLSLGDLPLFDLPSMHAVRLSNNPHLSARLPQQLFRLSLLRGTNLVSGTIPTTFVGEDRQVTPHFELLTAALVGTLPSQIGLADRMTYLSVHVNSLEGTLPSELGLLSLLTSLDVAFNRFSGALPSQLALLVALTRLDVSNNQLSSSIPPQLFALAQLGSVGMANNQLEGTVPPQHRDVWLADCDNSGVDNRECEYDCPACGSTSVVLKHCDWRGRGRVCAPVWSLCVGLVAVVAVYWMGARWLMLPTRGMHTVVFVGLCTFAVLNVFTDVLFILNKSGAAQVVLSTLLAATIIASLGLAAHVVSRNMGAPGWKKLLTCLLCTLSRVGLKRLPPVETHVVKIDLMLTVLVSLVQGGVQLSDVLVGKRDVITVVSLGFSMTALVGRMAVLAVLYLCEPHPMEESDEPKVLGLELSEMEDHSALPFEQQQVAPAHEQQGAPPSEVTQQGAPPSEVTQQDMASSPRKSQGQSGAQGNRESEASANNRHARRLALMCGCIAVSWMAVPSRQADSPTAVLVAQPPRLRSPGESQRNGVRQSLWLTTSEPRGGAKEAVDCSDDTLFCAGNTPFAFVSTGMGISQAVFEETLLEYTGLYFVVALGGGVTLPTEVGLLANLKVLALGSSATFSIPTQVGMLDELVLLLGGRCNGSIPSQLGQLASLQQLAFVEGDLQGTIPAELRNCPLTFAQIFSNDLAGNFASMWPQTLKTLDLSMDGLFGQLPSQLWQLTALERLILNDNRLTGTVATQLGMLTDLEELNLSYNDLGGDVFPALPLAGLNSLELHGNRFVGSLPTLIGLLSRLRILTLYSNELTGSLPSQIGLLTELRRLTLGSNAFSGTLPTQVALLTLLTSVNIEYNNFEGTLPLADDHVARVWWIQACHYSGIETNDRACNRECPGCGFGEVMLVECNDSGFDQVCLPAYAWVVAVLAYVAMCYFVLRRLNSKGKVARGHLVIAAVASGVSFAHGCADVLVWLLVGGWVQTASPVVLATALLVRGVLACSEFVRRENIHRSTRSLHMGGVAPEPGNTIERDVAAFSVGFACSLVDPFVLAAVPSLFHTPRRDWNRLRRLVVFSVLLNDVPQLAMQLTLIGQGRGSSEVVWACALTATSLCLLLGRAWSRNHFLVFGPPRGAFSASSASML